MRPDAASNWGGVCQTNFTLADAEAACRQLGVPVRQGIQDIRFTAPLMPGAKMWLGNVKCSGGTDQSITSGCTWDFSPTGSACDPGDAVGIDCITGTPAPTLPAPYTFYALFRPKVQLTQTQLDNDVKRQIAMYYGDDDDTLQLRVIIDESHQSMFNGSAQFNVTFHIADKHNEKGLSKRAIEETLIASKDEVFGSDLGLVSLTSDIPPPPPLQTHNTDSWQWRLSGGTSNANGRVEVNPYGPDWGTVCGTGFTASEAFAVCGTMGYPNPPHAVALRFFGGGTGYIFISDARCGLGQVFFKDCEFTLSSPDAIKNTCTHTDDVGVNCFFNTTLPPETTVLTYSPDHFLTPIAWTGTVSNVFYDANTLKMRLSNSLGIDQGRIEILGTVADDLYTHVTFVFREGTPDLPPAKSFNEELEQIDEIGLLLEFDFEELVNNKSGSMGTLPPSASIRWNVSLSDSNRGLVEVWPSTGGDKGTVCDVDFGRDGAMAACNSAGVQLSEAVVVPSFQPSGRGYIYLDQVSCQPGQTISGCSKRVSLPDNKLNNCTHEQDVGVICFDRTRTAPPNRNSNVSLFRAFAQAGRVDLPVVARTLKAFIPFDESRLVLTHVGFQHDTGITELNFFIADVPENPVDAEPPRDVLEYWLQHISAEQRLRHFFFYDLSWTYGAPQLPPPPQKHDLSQWSFKLATEAKKGLLLAKPPGDTHWGGVCGLHFNVQDAIAMCRTLGFHTDYALPFTLGDDNPIVLSQVTCPDPATGALISNCTTTKWNSTTVNLDCPRLHAVTLDCLPDADVLDPILFTAVVRKDGYTANGFINNITTDMNISASRMQLGQVRDDGTYKFVEFEFLDDHTVDASSTTRAFEAMSGNAPPPNGPSDSDTSAVSGPMDGSWRQSFGSTDGVLPLHGFPRPVLEMVMRELLPSSVRFAAWGIYELRMNTTQPNGAMSDDKSTWRFKLVNLVNDTAAAASVYGRLEMQMGTPNAPWGTVDCRRFSHNDALVACREVTEDPTISVALAVPFFVQPGAGQIYLSHVDCPSGTGTSLIHGCTFNASTRYVKKNNATHDEDVGLICGQRVIPDPAETITYKMGWNLEEEPASVMDRVKGTYADMLGIAESRITTSRYFDDNILLAIVEFTFGAPTTSSEPSEGDVHLFAQSINGWGVRELFGAVHFEFSTSIVPDHPSSGATPGPPPPTPLPPPVPWTTTTTSTSAPPATTPASAPTTTAASTTTTTTTTSTAASTTTTTAAPTPTATPPVTTPAVTTTASPTPTTTAAPETTTPTNAVTTRAPTTGAATTTAAGSTTTAAGSTTTAAGGTTASPTAASTTTTPGTGPTTTPAAPPPTTTGTSPTTPAPTETPRTTPPATTAAPSRTIDVTYDPQYTESQVVQRIASVLQVDASTITVVESDRARNYVVLEFATASLAERAVSASRDPTEKQAMGVESVTRAAAGDGPAPANDDKMPIAYYAAAGAGALVVIGVIAFAVRRARAGGRSGPRYHEEYVQMTEQLSRNTDTSPAPLHRV